MTLFNRRKKKLFDKLKSKEYRNAFVEESINVGIPFQIKTLREQRELKQKDMEQYGMKQTLISRLENLNYSGFSLSTLKKIASIFDIGLIVRFVPISDLVRWELNLNSESLKALSYQDDPYFKEKSEDELIIQSIISEDNIKRGLVNTNVPNLNEYRKRRENLAITKQAEEKIQTTSSIELRRVSR